MRSMLVGLVVAAWMGYATPAVAQKYEVLFSPRIGQQKMWVEYEALTYFNVDVDRQDEQLHMVRHDFDIGLPLVQDEQRELLMTMRARAMDLDTDALLPDTWDPLPNTLWDVRIGAMYRHRLNNDWLLGVHAEFGSASDRLFASTEEYVGTATGFLRIPHGDSNAFLFLVNYSSIRSFWPHIPLPGFGYEITAEDRLRLLLGVPMTNVFWEPVEGLELEGMYLIPRRVHAKVGYRIVDPLKVYAGFDWSNQRFLRHDRDDYDDRLFYYEKRVAGGVRWDIVHNVWLDCSAGWAFDRFFFEGEDYDDRGDNRINIDDGPFIMLQVGMKF